MIIPGKRKQNKIFAVIPKKFSSLYIDKSQIMDRGVFANKIFQPGELIETTPVIVISMAEWRIMKKTVLNNYAFSFEEDSQEMAIALGFGSLYNHSYNPNASYFKRIKEKVIDFYAIRLIKGGEEITINYNGDPNSTDLLWFNRD